MVSHRFIDSGNIIFRILGWGGGDLIVELKYTEDERVKERALID